MSDVLDQAIRDHRTGTLAVTTDPGAAVRVTQLGHEFWFGTTLNWGAAEEPEQRQDFERYLQTIEENFNSGVHEGALKWHSVEREPGKPDYRGADRILEWCEKHGLAMRGHCIFWAAEHYVPGWVKLLSEAELRKAVERRAREVPRRYRGRIVEYDVNNEMTHTANRFFRGRLGEEIAVDMFRWAQEEDPAAKLFLNEFDILTGKRIDEYCRLIESMLDAGAPVGGLGCQAHTFDEEGVDLDLVQRCLDRLGQYGLPIRITEYGYGVKDPEDEQVQADGLRGFYRTCFAHRAVEGVLMWGFWRGRHWQKHHAIWREDWSLTPAAEAYRELVFGDWWTRWQGQADERGVCNVPAFFGRHRVQVAGGASELDDADSQRVAEVELRRAEGTQAVALKR